MKASRRKHRKRDRGPGAPGERSVRQPARRGPKRHPMEWWAPVGLVAFGAMLLLKVVFTLMEGTASDDLEHVSRDGDPLAYWMFVATYGVMGLGLVWWGVNEWRRAD